MSAELWLFILFGILGVFGELVFTALQNIKRERSFRLRGHSSIWMFPIYGLIAILFPLLHRHIADWSWPLRGAAYMIIIYLIEYLTGAVLKKVLGTPVWQYHGRFQLHGHIRLAHAPVWFGVGLLVEHYFDFILILAQKIVSL